MSDAQHMWEEMKAEQDEDDVIYGLNCNECGEAQDTEIICQQLLQWLSKKVREEKGTVEFGITTNGDIGLWCNSRNAEKPDGVGDTAEEAIDAAMSLLGE
jgi:hypothetical protein